MNHKVVLVTGSSRGIGSVLVENFAEKGFKVVINYSKSESEALSLEKKISEKSGSDSVLCIRADVSDRNQVNEMFDQIYTRFNSCDILINNAGVNRDRPFLEMNSEEWRTVTETILTGSFNCSQEFAKRYKNDNRKIGHIINIGALTGMVARKNGVNYCTARAGILNMTRCLALELAPGIAVNTVTPGCIETEEVVRRYHLDNPENYRAKVDHVPFERLGTPVDIFNAVYSIVNYITYMTGQNIVIDGGFN